MKVLVLCEDCELDSALEVIHAAGGVVTSRELVQLGDDAPVEIGDANTCILREVKIPVRAEPNGPNPGARAHGDLGPALATTNEVAGMLEEQHTEHAPAMSGVESQEKMSQSEVDSRLRVVASIAEIVAKGIEDGDSYFDDDVVLLTNLKSIVEVCTLPFDQLPAEVKADVQKTLDQYRAAQDAATAHADACHGQEREGADSGKNL